MARDTGYVIPDNAPKAGEIYRHYKGDLYRVVFLTAHNDPDELCVVYEADYKNPMFPRYSRLLSGWSGKVEWQGQIVKRFTKVEE